MNNYVEKRRGYFNIYFTYQFFIDFIYFICFGNVFMKVFGKEIYFIDSFDKTRDPKLVIKF